MKLLCLMLWTVLASKVNPLEDRCNHWNTTTVPLSAEPTIDCMTSSVLDSGRST